MLVLTLENAAPKLIGYCSSWAIQVSTHVFVAQLPERAREEIWERVVRLATFETNAVMIWSSGSKEQGLDFRVLGEPRRYPVDIEGFIVSAFKRLPEDSP